jgi:Ser/Thr protein kinase RdoA (MazF antagonist)
VLRVVLLSSGRFQATAHGARWQAGADGNVAHRHRPGLLWLAAACAVVPQRHHDLAPWNLVVGRRWAFIDWDNAGPGSRLWDVAYAVHGFVPMSASPHWQRRDAGARLRVFADAYGLAEAERRELAPMLARRTQSMHDFLAGQAAAGNQPWLGLWQAGHGDAWGADTRYLERNEARWADALLG